MARSLQLTFQAAIFFLQCRLVSTAGKRFGPMFRQFFAPLMDPRVANAQLTGDLGNRLSAGLRKPDCLALKLLYVRLLHFLLAPGSPSGIVYPNTTVPLKRFKLRTGRPPQTEARRARCVSTPPLSASGDSGWPPSTTVQSARAVHARTSQYGRPRACLPRSSDDQSQGGLFVASVAARGDTGVPSGHR